MEQPIIFYVEWIDSASTYGWIASADIDKVCGPGNCCTVGFLVREDDLALVLAFSGATDEKTSPHRDCLAIPKVCITKRQQLMMHTLEIAQTNQAS